METHSENRHRTYWLLAVIVLVFLVVTSLNYPLNQYGHDYWEHSASLKELSAHPFTPRNPHINSGVPSPRYTVYLLFWAIVQNVFNTNVFQTMALMSIVNTVILLTGLYYFVREYFRDSALPLYVLVVMLFFWGKGFNWSNEYQLRSLIYSISYPSSFSFACFFWGAYFIVKYQRIGGAAMYVLSVLLGWVTFLCHPPTAAPLFLTAVVLAVIERNVCFKRRLFIAAMPFISVLLSLLWPYFSMYNLFLGTAPSNIVKSSLEVVTIPLERHPLHSTALLKRLGPALLGVIFIWNFAVRKKYWLVSICFVVCGFIYAASWFYPVPMGHRFIFFTVFYMHLAIALGLRELKLFTGSSIKQAMFGIGDAAVVKLLFISLTICAVLYNVNLVRKSYIYDLRLSKGTGVSMDDFQSLDIVERFSFLEEIIGPYDVVMADEKTSWVLPSFCGKVISVPERHENPLIADSMQRRRDHAEFFEQGTTTEQRANLLDKYDVSYILINNDLVDPQIAAEIEKLGTAIITKNNLTLIKI
ncbi:MAG: hypothetical protein JW804_04820 [Sedimentisphaerales bacterium]|nr:hypothetical protein [Sedimentisphaerales bacterium]